VIPMNRKAEDIVMIQTELFGHFAMLDTYDGPPRICFITDDGDAETVEELLASAEIQYGDLYGKNFVIRIQEDE